MTVEPWRLAIQTNPNADCRVWLSYIFSQPHLETAFCCIGSYENLALIWKGLKYILNEQQVYFSF